MVDGLYGEEGVGERRDQQHMVKLYLAFHIIDDSAFSNGIYWTSLVTNIHLVIKDTEVDCQ